MFSFLRRKKAVEPTPDGVLPAVSPVIPTPTAQSTLADVQTPLAERADFEPAAHASGPTEAVPAPQSAAEPAVEPVAIIQPRTGWLGKLTSGLRKTGSSIATVFTGGAQIDETLYEELEAALLQADAGVAATQFLLDDLKRRVKAARATDPHAVRALLVEAMADLLVPLQKTLVVGQYHPTIIMVEGVNGAGKTTSIGKLTRHLADAGATVLLAAADTFRAAAREQLAVWAGRNQVEIISQHGADPAAVAFDAVAAGRARGQDVVLIDTAGRLPTQKHL
ncbi:MAG: signal recognition particle receptor subunit alpha, partial [Burkholderiaceae bacterium]|nr:signal recognition particle receptor subunit alpha [Burkholderiaceae bacterium]